MSRPFERHIEAGAQASEPISRIEHFKELTSNDIKRFCDSPHDTREDTLAGFLVDILNGSITIGEARADCVEACNAWLDTLEIKDCINEIPKNAGLRLIISR